MNVTPTNATLAGVEALIREHKKIHAIKEYRVLTGASLKVAKEAVEEFEAQGRWPTGLNVHPASFGGDSMNHHASPSAAVPQRPAEAEHLSAIQAALASGQKILAIKLYRELYGVGLKEAKDAVEHFQAYGRWEERPEPRATSAVAAGSAGSPSPASNIGSNSYAANVFTSGVSSASSVPSAPMNETTSNAVTAALRNKLGAVPVLGSVPAECGLYKGFLFITDQRVAFVADRFGNWEVTEDFARSEVERVEVKEDPFGHEIVVQAGFHSAHFSELSRSTAENLAKFLKGETRELALEASNTGADNGAAPYFSGTALAPPAEFSSSASLPPELMPPSESFAQQSALPGEMQTVKHPPLGSPAPGPTMALPARNPASGVVSVIGALLLALFAAIPATAYGSAWRFIPMEGFPRIADSVLFWAALALGGTLMRGEAARLMRAGFVAGILDWAISDLGGMYVWGTLFPCVILGASFGRRDKDDQKGLLIGVALAVPIVALNALLRAISMETFILPTLPFAFWSVQFIAAALRNRHAATSANA